MAALDWGGCIAVVSVEQLAANVNITPAVLTSPHVLADR
jgi:hypothetical protein